MKKLLGILLSIISLVLVVGVIGLLRFQADMPTTNDYERAVYKEYRDAWGEYWRVLTQEKAEIQKELDEIYSMYGYVKKPTELKPSSSITTAEIVKSLVEADRDESDKAFAKQRMPPSVREYVERLETGGGYTIGPSFLVSKGAHVILPEPSAEGYAEKIGFRNFKHRTWRQDPEEYLKDPGKYRIANMNLFDKILYGLGINRWRYCR